jgi:cation diffusion facilitator family transporter
MADFGTLAFSPSHDHVFLGADHEGAERRTWGVIWLCAFMMVAEIIGGAMFGSIALIADGLHMSTHAGALLLAAVAYTYARKHANDPSYAFGTGKVGDLAGYSSAVILAMIALLICYEAVMRLLVPVPIHFNEAISIAVLGLGVNVASAWLLSGGGHHHDHGHGLTHGAAAHDQHGQADEVRRIDTAKGTFVLEVFEEGVPPRFRIRLERGEALRAEDFALETVRPDGVRQSFTFADQGDYLESIEDIPEPHAFAVRMRATASEAIHEVTFEEHDLGHAVNEAAHRDHNIRAALVHVIADAAVSVLVIVGLVLARTFGWLWMDPLAGLIGAVVIANWSYGLLRDTGSILLDRMPDQSLAEKVRKAVETDGDRLTDLHLWRLGPGHLGAIVSVETTKTRGPEHYHSRLARFPSLSHVTVEVQRAA